MLIIAHTPIGERLRVSLGPAIRLLEPVAGAEKSEASTSRLCLFGSRAKCGHHRFDPETLIAACSTADGTIHVFHEDFPKKISAVETVKTEYGAKTAESKVM